MKPLISLHDYGRPWKLFTLTCGIALLIAGSYWQPAPDWDIPISLIMSVGTYFCAPVSTRIVARRRWKLLPLALFLLWLCVDGVYWAYWSWRNPEALAQINARSQCVRFHVPVSAVRHDLAARRPVARIAGAALDKVPHLVQAAFGKRKSSLHVTKFNGSRDLQPNLVAVILHFAHCPAAVLKQPAQ